jgi:rhamnopyranosyl-N-acetylglucosaminyl-diphospho-decaprenol beta-1,3/1,4-galactofuranosyltransferase
MAADHRELTVPATVYAVVVTYNRKELLLDCLRALEAQTHPLSGVLVVDNASTDGTREALEESGMALDYLHILRNGGGAEGFHYGVLHGRDAGCDWIWLMDDDCVPEPDALERLLAAPQTGQDDTVLVAPVVESADRDVLPLNRGWLRPRWFRGPLVGLSPEHWQGGPLEIGYVSLVGPLVRTDLARRTEPPRREFFIWFDDLEWTARLAGLGRMWLVPDARIVHKDERALPDTTKLGLVRDLLRGDDFRAAWKRMYGLRNILWSGRRHGFFDAPRAASFVLVNALRALASGRPRLRRLRLTLGFARDGWRGRFHNVPPNRWPELADERDPFGYLQRESLRYDEEADSPIRRLGPQPNPRREASR